MSDASDGARPDAVVDGCPSGHHPDRLADADAGKLADQVRVARPADACLAPVYWQQEPEAVQAPNTPDADPSAERLNAGSAVPELDGPAAHFHPAVVVVRE